MSPRTPTFNELGAPRPVVEVLADRGIHEPFPIQAAVLADALDGRDILGRAPTGSGKTLAFGIPVVARMERASRRRPTALVLSPTRELAEQIAVELGPLAEAMGHSTATVYGGVGYQPQRRALDRGAGLLVACPGRLEDLIEMGALDLGDVGVVVVDEADRMADMGFLPAVRRLVAATRADRHLMLFSATLEGPVAKLTRDFQHDPVRHEVGSTEPDMTSATHLFWEVERADRSAETARFIDRVGSTVVFTRTRHGADRLSRQLEKLGVPAAPIHGARSQPQRSRALAAFAEGRVRALVATDVAARGIHVDDVAAVVHFDPPEDGATYVHRSGRTARAGATGLVLSLLDPAQAKPARRMQKELGLPVGVGPVDLRVLPDIPAPPPRPARTPKATARTPKSADRAPRPDRRANGQRTAARPHTVDAERPARRELTGGERRPTPRPGTDGDALVGKVTSYSTRKGYGFIKVKGRDDVFVHFSEVKGDPLVVLSKGNRVSFELGRGRKGPVAVRVQAADAAD
jgi:superfamily II DNA/RNA helicase